MTPYEKGGRTGQKRRTRDALVAAARQLVAEGGSPTVEAAATAAAISRTTAYRYFPNQKSLLAAAHPETAISSLLPGDAPPEAEERLDLAIDALTRMVVRTEQQQRTMLRLSLEDDAARRGPLPLRQGRAIGWIEEALAPLASRIGRADLRRLALAIRSASGIESFVWLVDVAGLSRKQAVDTMRWSARALLRTALAERR